MTLWTRLQLIGKLLLDWDLFKHQFDAAVQDPEVKRALANALADNPTIAQQYGMLSAYWKVVERDINELKK